MKIFETDIAVIGGGAAGLTAAYKCAELNTRTILLERSRMTGGVLNQCIHSGFGLHYFNEELTGPEYAARLAEKAVTHTVKIMTSCTVNEITQTDGKHNLTVFSKEHGIFQVSAKAVILAMGCREKCRGNLGIPGERCAGVFNAGLAQQLINQGQYIPGSKAVIVGSGDIGLIMARRLTWSGVKVECAVEIMPYPAGLSRNIAQCLEDFNIPLYLNHTVTGIHGQSRVEAVSIAPLKNGIADLTREQKIECDTVLFSVGLVPENELVHQCGIQIDQITNGAIVDGNLMTSVKGIFSCGNVLHVHDLVDFVSLEAERAAANAVKFCRNELAEGNFIPIFPGENVRYTVPQKVDPSQKNNFFLRSKKIMEQAMLEVKDQTGKIIHARKLSYIKPAEMISFELADFYADALEISLKEL